MSNIKSFLSRDLQINMGEQITAGLHGKFLNDGFFNILCSTQIIRAAALKKLSKLTILTVNHSQAQIASYDRKECLYVDFSKLSGYLYLRRLVNELIKCDCKLFTHIYLISLHGVDPSKLMDILLPLQDIQVLSLPFEFGKYSKKLERFIQNNADTLTVLKHATLQTSIPRKMKERLRAINCATLRSGTLEKEDDFFAFYTEVSSSAEELDGFDAKDDGIFLKISVHRHTEPFRAMKRAFTNKSFLSKITSLKLIATANFDTASALILLKNLACSRSYFQNLIKLDFELKIADTYPNHFPFDDDEDGIVDFRHVSPSTTDAQLLANFTLAWLQAQRQLPFQTRATVCLAVDYITGERETSGDLLDKAMNETITFFGQRWQREMQWTKSNGNYTASTIQQLNATTQFNFKLEYRSLKLSKKGMNNNRRFDIGHTL